MGMWVQRLKWRFQFIGKPQEDGAVAVRFYPETLWLWPTSLNMRAFCKRDGVVIRGRVLAHDMCGAAREIGAAIKQLCVEEDA